MEKTVVIHQPEYFPWLGFLDKARQADVLVFLDSVQFDRSSLQHRAKVLGPQGLTWLTIPFVHRFPQRIDEVEIADKRWSTKHEKTLQACYGRAPGYKAVAPKLHAFFEGCTTSNKLLDAAIGSSMLLLDAFGVTPKTVLRSSAMDVTGDKGDLVLDICKKLGATRYLSGRTGATYLGEDMFTAVGMKLAVQRFELRPYATRPLEEAQGGLSALDAWFLLGDAAKTYFDSSIGSTP
ncbi:MAG: WbqC family protein [Polyangiaceae bacterium]